MRHLAILLGFSALLAGCSSAASDGVPDDSQVADSYAGQYLGNSSTIGCSFEWATEESYENSTILHGFPKKQKQPIVFIFSDLDTDSPKIKSIGAGNTVYEASPTVLANTPDKIVLVELTPIEKNIFIYMIHRNTGIATWTKQYQWEGRPLGMLAMGKCSSSAE